MNAIILSDQIPVFSGFLVSASHYFNASRGNKKQEAPSTSKSANLISTLPSVDIHVPQTCPLSFIYFTAGMDLRASKLDSQ